MIIPARAKHTLTKSAKMPHHIRIFSLLCIIFLAGCSSSTKAPTTDVLSNNNQQSTQPNQQPATNTQNGGLSSTPYQDSTATQEPLFDNITPFASTPSQSTSDILSDPNQPPLDKVEELVQNQNYADAQSIAARIDKSRLSLKDQARLSLAEGTIFAANNQNDAALQALNNIQPSLLSLADNSRFFWLKARTQYQTGDSRGALESLANRENYIEQSEIPANQSMMQNIMSELTEEEKQQLAQSTENPNLLYWLGEHQYFQSTPNNLSSGINSPQIFNPNIGSIDSSWQTTSPRQVAVLLPYNSNFATAAKEFEKGINQAHNTNNFNKPQLRFYDVGAGDIQAKMNIAIQNGADFIIGPLGKNASETALNLNNPIPILTIGGQSYDNQINQYTFSLTPESEGNAIAQHARAQGLVNAIILTPNSPQSERLTNAFQNTWQSLGGTSQTHEFTPGEFDQSTVVKIALGIYGSEQRFTELSSVIGSKPKFNVSRKEDIDLILLASNFSDAKNIKPQLNFYDAFSVPTYGASSLNRLSAPDGEKADLDGLIIPEMTALVPNDDTTTTTTTTTKPSRLQALGHDAYQLIPIITQLQSNSYQGMTGKLVLDSYGNTVRLPTWAKFSSGKLVKIP